MQHKLSRPLLPRHALLYDGGIARYRVGEMDTGLQAICVDDGLFSTTATVDICRLNFYPNPWLGAHANRDPAPARGVRRAPALTSMLWKLEEGAPIVDGRGRRG